MTPEEQAEFDKLEAAEKAAAAEKTKAAEKPAKAKKGDDDAPRTRVLTKKSFINGRLYEAGETVDEDADGNFLAVPKSKLAGDLNEEELKQLLAKVQAAGRSAA